MFSLYVLHTPLRMTVSTTFVLESSQRLGKNILRSASKTIRESMDMWTGQHDMTEKKKC